MWPQRRKIEILEKRLSPTAQNHFADLEDTCSDKVTKVGVIVRCIKKVIEKNEGWGQIWPQVAFWGLKKEAAYSSETLVRLEYHTVALVVHKETTWQGTWNYAKLVLR
jgi:hypothetical protein